MTDLSRLQRLATVFAELAEAGDDVEAGRAVDLCLAFADRIIRDREIEQRIVNFLRDSERTEGESTSTVN